MTNTEITTDTATLAPSVRLATEAARGEIASARYVRTFNDFSGMVVQHVVPADLLVGHLAHLMGVYGPVIGMVPATYSERVDYLASVGISPYPWEERDNA